MPWILCYTGRLTCLKDYSGWSLWLKSNKCITFLESMDRNQMVLCNKYSHKYRYYHNTCNRNATYAPFHFSEALNPFFQNAQCLLLIRPKNGGRGDQVLLKAVYQRNGKLVIHLVLVSNQDESRRKKGHHHDICPTYIHVYRKHILLCLISV